MVRTLLSLLLSYHFCRPFCTRLNSKKEGEAVQLLQSDTSKHSETSLQIHRPSEDSSQRSSGSAISVDPSPSSSGVGPLLKTEMVDGVAVVTMLGEGTFPWGTRVLEHRINPSIVAEINKALDEAERNEANSLMLIGEGRFFSNGFDLQFITANINQSTNIQKETERLLARILGFGMPTVAAINGHAAAAGAMLALAFDKRVMAGGSAGQFFVPGIDIGLVYSQGMTELMKAKLPQRMWNDVFCMGERYKVAQLFQEGVVNLRAPSGEDLYTDALRLASDLKTKGKDAKTRDTMSRIKANLYKDALAALHMETVDMGFANGTFDSTGRAAKKYF
mmetsp:Transcript_48565/g.75617  ORF Transcript_48565/g.75617 Transcript_48565/m.75617 type:complete len:334 (+) Transcript_48565:77-1078(+)